MIKVNIISGYLGAGKTSLIQKLLAESEFQKEKIVILVNEFGKIGIDADIIRKSNYDTFEINKGCLCCSLKGEFKKTLRDIAETINPDRVIIEPSGIFIVEDAIDIFDNEELEKHYEIRNIVNVVDSTNFVKVYNSGLLFTKRQLAYSDVAILSKSDLCTSDELKDVKSEIKKINDSCIIIDANSDFNSVVSMLNTQRRLTKECIDTDKEESRHKFNTITINCKIFNNITDLQNILQNIDKSNIERIKGIVATREGNYKIDYSSEKLEFTSSELDNTQLVFIGKELEQQKIDKKFCDYFDQ